jgi:hypothetical protein
MIDLVNQKKTVRDFEAMAGLVGKACQKGIEIPMPVLQVFKRQPGAYPFPYA